MGDVVDISARLRVWHACDLECPCTHQWYAPVPRALLQRAQRCPECGGQTGRVIDDGDVGRTREEARAICELATRGASGPPPPEVA